MRRGLLLSKYARGKSHDLYMSVFLPPPASELLGQCSEPGLHNTRGTLRSAGARPTLRASDEAGLDGPGTRFSITLPKRCSRAVWRRRAALCPWAHGPCSAAALCTGSALRSKGACM